MSDVKPWPLPTGHPVDPPKRIFRPSEYGLRLAIDNLECQFGTIEAYNRLVEAAATLRATIDAGKAKAQNPLFAVSIDGSRLP